MPGDWKQIIQEKFIEAGAITLCKITLCNYVPGFVAKGITLARKGIEWVFDGRNEAESDWVGKIEEVAEKAENVLAESEREEAESDWVGKIEEVAEKAENVLAEYEREKLPSWMFIEPTANKKRRRLGRQRMTSTVAELGEIEEEEASHEFYPGAGDPRVVGNERRSVSGKRKDRGYYNYNYDDLMIMPSRGLEEDPQRFCVSKYGDDGRFTSFYSTATPHLKWTFPGTGGLPFTFVCFSGFEGGRTCLRLKGTCIGSTTEAVLGTERCRLIHVVRILPRPYMLTVDAWADSSSGRWKFVFSVIPVHLKFNGLECFTRICSSQLIDIKSNKNKILKIGRKVEDIMSLEYKMENSSMSFIERSESSRGPDLDLDLDLDQDLLLSLYRFLAGVWALEQEQELEQEEQELKLQEQELKLELEQEYLKKQPLLQEQARSLLLERALSLYQDLAGTRILLEQGYVKKLPLLQEQARSLLQERALSLYQDLAVTRILLESRRSMQEESLSGLQEQARSLLQERALSLLSILQEVAVIVAGGSLSLLERALSLLERARSY